ncbi:hypothetical protein ONE63_007312 [Megalurothrips usitatus]|uniref:Secreted protein n=1 Tax=Megalurothrips usitatus TaxID=439358 RepID=A0AAV7XWL2_9NEOP|nr:hypothetical protein ONE63_007312 [Megalurothrips usitatus]
MRLTVLVVLCSCVVLAVLGVGEAREKRSPMMPGGCKPTSSKGKGKAPARFQVKAPSVLCGGGSLEVHQPQPKKKIIASSSRPTQSIKAPKPTAQIKKSWPPGSPMSPHGSPKFHLGN